MPTCNPSPSTGTFSSEAGVPIIGLDRLWGRHWNQPWTILVGSTILRRVLGVQAPVPYPVDNAKVLWCERYKIQAAEVRGRGAGELGR